MCSCPGWLVVWLVVESPVSRPSPRPHSWPGQRTCDGVQGRDGKHEDGGEVEVPAQTDVHKERPCIQVNLGNRKGTVRTLEGTAGAWALLA